MAERYPFEGVLHEDGKWELVATKINTIVGGQGWKSIIRHDCEKAGSPYWMLLETHLVPTICVYCNEDMPASIIALFKFQNDEVIR